MAILSLPLLIPVAHRLGWVSYALHSNAAAARVDIASVTFVAGIWFGVRLWWISRNDPLPTGQPQARGRLALLARVLGFAYGSVLALGVSIVWSWVDGLLSPLIRDALDDVSLSFCLGGVIGYWFFLAGRILRG